MGIKGLVSYLKDKNVSAKDATLNPNNTTLLIDGSGKCLYNTAVHISTLEIM